MIYNYVKLSEHDQTCLFSCVCEEVVGELSEVFVGKHRTL